MKQVIIALKMLPFGLMIFFVNDLVAQTNETSLANIKQEIKDLLPHYDKTLAITKQQDLAPTLIVQQKNYEGLIDYDNYLNLALAENGNINIFEKKCQIYIASGKIINQPVTSQFDEKPKSPSTVID